MDIDTIRNDIVYALDQPGLLSVQETRTLSYILGAIDAKDIDLTMQLHLAVSILKDL